MIERSGFGKGPAAQELAVATAAQLGLLAVLGEIVGLDRLGWLAGVVYATILWAVLAAALRRSPTGSLGPADRVTLARAVLVGGVTALVVGGSRSGMAPTLLATLALVLDAVDGKVARRTGTASPFGARFDMEVDAFLILVLSVQLAMAQGAWVLAIGAMRYVFVAAALVLPWLTAALPPSFARKTVAALQGIILIVADAGLLPEPVTTIVAALALASLVWSFGRDAVWLWQHRQDIAGTDSRLTAQRLLLTGQSSWRGR
ncbi:CDP-alcohol phosphatidyltransferase family protein [Streptomyces sp. NPDC005500]|uniref:CDP-alcohol phosphatidyltransferase family protein n=1 Tax=Streptomyces sp. NPDC005500 TaxID=3155007 RepID=UPI0033AFED68